MDELRDELGISKSGEFPLSDNNPLRNLLQSIRLQTANILK